MKVYLVGGYVRDTLLNKDLSLSDKDYVVVGALPSELLSRGYRQVGKSFPVFIHPESGDEYALARKEVKTGKGYKEFDFIFTPDITLEEDLKRRDFTINAIAQDSKGKIYDPFLGQKDLSHKIIRHVSEHFSEDPLRVLRAARFASVLNFEISQETQALILDIIKSGELSFLTSERVLMELKKVFLKGNIQIFSRYLSKWNISKELFGNELLNVRHFDDCNALEQEILFFLDLPSQNLSRYKVSRIVETSVSKTQKAYELLNTGFNSGASEVYEALKLLGLIKTNSNVDILKIYGLFYDCLDFTDWLARLVLFLKKELSLDGMESLKGKSYGEELALRYIKLIDKYKSLTY